MDNKMSINKKSERGVSLSALMIYIIAMLIVISTISVIASSFYSNIDVITNESNSQKEFSRFNMFFTKDVNSQNAEINKIDEENSSYIVFTNNGDKHQYTFKNNAIYMNKIKICNNVTDCKFYVSNDDTNSKNIKVFLKIGEDFTKTLNYSFTGNFM